MAPRNGTRSRALFPIVTLAFWQVRQTWRLLLVSGVGILAAAILICTMPLYSQVALSSGLHATLQADSTNSSINILSTLRGLQQPDTISTLSQQITQTMQADISGDAVDAQSEFVVTIGGTPILSPHSDSPLPARLSSGQADPDTVASLPQIQLTGLGQDQLASHVHLTQGRLPHQSSDSLEIALLPATARCLFLYAPSANQSPNTCFSAHAGDEITVLSPLRTPIQDNSSPSPVFINGQRVNGRYIYSALKLHVVGLFTPLNEADPFWHGNSFGVTSSASGNTVTGLTSSEALASMLDHAVQSRSSSAAFNTSLNLFWFYHLNIANIDASTSSSLGKGINNFVSDMGNSSAEQGGVQTTAVGPTDILNTFSSRATQAQVPVALLLLLVIGMVILFISIVTELLVERQTDAIALLRSRGASRSQVFGVFTTQMIVLSLLALIIGPFLAIPLTVLLVQHLFSSLDAGAVSLITSQPLLTVWNVRWYALAAVGLSLVVTLFTLYQTTRFDVLALRREAGRSTHIAFWQRFYLDGLLAVLALGCYGYALYSINTGTLDPTTSVQVLSPLIMGAAALFLLACVLLFLRFFPRLVRLVGNLAAHRDGAASMIALSQIARAPRQAVRTILLLTLTTAFAIFALVFSASQAQRIVDVVNYQVGADFSSQFSTATTNGQAVDPLSKASLAVRTASYQAIPGVLSASMGIVTPAQLGNTLLVIKAVDTTTFAKTAIWTSKDSGQPIDTLMTQLSSNRPLALTNQVVPAIVDTETWNALHLSQGQHFTLTLNAVGFNGVQIPFFALAETQHIPTMISAEGGNLSSQGILVDYQSFSPVFTKITHQSTSLNYLWLHTRADENALESVRAALAQRLPHTSDTTIYDRQAFITTLQQDPLTLNLTGILTIGALTPLLLALLGSLLLSWMSARNRLLNFAVLRALGSSPGQVAGVLSWEQCTVYILMLALGVLSGILLSAMVLPSLILTSIAISGGGNGVTSNLSYQGDLPAIQIIIPQSLLLVLGLLIVICALTLGLMARIVSRPSMSQTLRLNAD